MVSILMTVYNCEAYIGAAVRSALAQDFQDFEVIVVDDGSTDGTNTVLRRISDKRLKIFEPGRLGRARALNFGIARSSAGYIAILDADDLSLPNRLKDQTAFLRDNPDHAIVGSRYRTRIDEIGARLPNEDIEPMAYPDIVAKFKNKGNALFHSSTMFRRHMIESVGCYDTSLPCLVDFDLYVRVAGKFPIANIDARLSLKRIHDRRFFGGLGGILSGPDAVQARSVIRSRMAMLPTFPRVMGPEASE